MTKKNGMLSFFFTLPAFSLYSLFMILPIVMSFYYAMTIWDGAGDKQFVFLQNFQNLIMDSSYWKVVTNSLTLIGLHLLIQTPLALLFSFLLYRTLKGLRFFRSVFFLPTIIAASVIGLMFSLMLNSDMGPVNALLGQAGLDSLKKNWLSDSRYVLYTVSLTMVWQYIGYHMAILLAGMQSISEEVIDAATIDGTSEFGLFFRIVLPLIKDVLQVSLILSITGCLKAFDHAYIMTWGGPGIQSSYLALYMFKTAFLQSNLGTGTAIAITILLFAFIFTRLVNFLFYGREDANGKIS
jgi:raffinose/stachyose/melibiose transport system permease protein